jgi:hypothetical protein
MERIWAPPPLAPVRGGHTYIHPTALCPVACQHCMYSSSLEHKGKSWLTPSDGHKLSNTLREIAPAKITFSGGGEPFLKLSFCLDVIRKSSCGLIEFVTAANWANSLAHTTATLTKIAEALSPNQRGLIRVSVDSFHWDAPRLVAFKNYANVIEAFKTPFIKSRLDLAFRSLLRERSMVEDRFISEMSAIVHQLNDWNSKLSFGQDFDFPITYNVMRFSGAASTNALVRFSDDLAATEYYQRFAGLPTLGVANALNHASAGLYPSDTGLAFTFDYDCSYFIFGATPPDWRGDLELSFEENLRLFSLDPITQYAVLYGTEGAMKLMHGIDPEQVTRARVTEDVASLIPIAFANARERAAARLLAIGELARGGMDIANDSWPLPRDGKQATYLVDI